jgi:hypothetical protein
VLFHNSEGSLDCKSQDLTDKNAHEYECPNKFYSIINYFVLKHTVSSEFSPHTASFSIFGFSPLELLYSQLKVLI